MTEHNQNPEKNNDEHLSSESDSPEVQQFSKLIKQSHGRAQREQKRPVFISYSAETDPDTLERAQQAGELFSRPEIQDEFDKTHQPYATFRGRVEDIHEFTNQGKRRINLSYRPIGLKVPFAIGFQAKEGSDLFTIVDQLPKDYRGEIIVTNNEHGGVGSVQMTDV